MKLQMSLAPVLLASCLPSVIPCFVGCSSYDYDDLAAAVKQLEKERNELEADTIGYDVAKEECLQTVCKDVSGLDYADLQRRRLNALDALSAESDRTLRDAQASLAGHDELISDEAKLGNSSDKIRAVRVRVDNSASDLEQAKQIIARAETKGTKENSLYEALMRARPEIQKYDEQKQRVGNTEKQVEVIRRVLDEKKK